MANIRRIVGFTLASLAVALLLDPRESGAEEVDAAGIIQQIDLYDALLKYPQPAWISGQIEPSELLDRSAFFKEQNGPTFIFEQIPIGQSFERWKSLYAVIAEELRPDQAVPIPSFVRLAVEANKHACTDDGFGVQVLASDARDAMVVMICGSTVHGRPDIGYGPDVGELSVWRFLVFENTYIKVYHRWRGAAFGLDSRGDWPVAEPELQEMVRRMADQVEALPNDLRR